MGRLGVPWVRRLRRRRDMGMKRHLGMVGSVSFRLRLRKLPLLSRLRRARINKGSDPVEDSLKSTSNKDCSDVRVHEIASLLRHS